MRIGAMVQKRTKKAPEGVRPTPAKVRQALFNILRGRIAGASFLELYAGTGLVGSAALEAGAAAVLWVDKNASFLSRRLEKDRLENVAAGKVTSSDVHRFLRGNEALYDIVFADPPYYTGEVEELMKSLSLHPPLNRGGVFVLEHSRRVDVPDSAGKLHKTKTYRYGDTCLSLYEMGSGPDSEDEAESKEEDG